jgi:hypothetical protein
MPGYMTLLLVGNALLPSQTSAKYRNAASFLVDRAVEVVTVYVIPVWIHEQGPLKSPSVTNKQ